MFATANERRNMADQLPPIHGGVRAGALQSAKIRALYRGKGMTQEDLAHAVGVCPSQMSLFMNGRREMKVGTFKALCRVLGTDPKEIW